MATIICFACASVIYVGLSEEGPSLFPVASAWAVYGLNNSSEGSSLLWLASWNDAGSSTGTVSLGRVHGMRGLSRSRVAGFQKNREAACPYLI